MRVCGGTAPAMKGTLARVALGIKYFQEIFWHFCVHVRRAEQPIVCGGGWLRGPDHLRLLRGGNAAWVPYRRPRRLQHRSRPIPRGVGEDRPTLLPVGTCVKAHAHGVVRLTAPFACGHRAWGYHPCRKRSTRCGPLGAGQKKLPCPTFPLDTLQPLRHSALCRGAVAQLGERLNGIQEAVSSILSSSTKKTNEEGRLGDNLIGLFVGNSSDLICWLWCGAGGVAVV